MSDALVTAGTAFLAAYDEVKDLEQKLKDAKELRDKREEELLDTFSQCDAQTIVITHNDMARTLSPSRDLLPSIPAELKDDAIAVFKENAMDDLVIETIPAPRLKSWVKEQEMDENDMPIIPEPLDEMIKVFEKFKVSCRKAPKKKKPKKRS